MSTVFEIRDFRLWLCRLLGKRGLDVDLSDLGESEVYPMLATKFENYEKKVLKRGKQEGRREGLQKGLQKGRQEALKLLLKLKFGEEGRRLWEEVEATADTRRLEKVFRLAIVAAHRKDSPPFGQVCSASARNPMTDTALAGLTLGHPVRAAEHGAGGRDASGSLGVITPGIPRRKRVVLRRRRATRRVGRGVRPMGRA